MRPDRIVVGEVRGGEALDMLQALTTGHEGSLSTLHASSPADGLRRLQTMALMGDVDLPYRAVADQVASAIDLVVHLARLADGRRRIVEIAAVRAGPGGAVCEPLVRWESQGRREDEILGRFVPSAREAAWRQAAERDAGLAEVG
jgi:pilus assembly protein CpaF